MRARESATHRGPALGMHPPRPKASSTAPASSGTESTPAIPHCDGSLVIEEGTRDGSDAPP